MVVCFVPSSPPSPKGAPRVGAPWVFSQVNNEIPPTLNRWRPVLAGVARRGFSEASNPAHCSEPLSKCPPHRLAEEADLGGSCPVSGVEAKAPAWGWCGIVESVGPATALVLTVGVIGSTVLLL